MMPLDARFSALPTPANDTRPPDEGDGARAGNPFGGLLDELGRGAAKTGAGGEAAPETRGTDEAAGSPSPDAPAPTSGKGAKGGTDLSRLIARLLTRSGGMGPTAAQSPAGNAQAETDGARPSALGLPLQGQGSLSNACDLSEPTARDAAADRAADLDGAKGEALAGEATTHETGGLSMSGMAALLVCMAPQTAGRTSAALPHDPDAPTQDGAHQAGMIPTSGSSDEGAQTGLSAEAPRLVAKVLDVQTHFAPIRSLVSASPSPSAHTVDQARIIRAEDKLASSRPLSVSPDLATVDTFPSAVARPAAPPTSLSQSATGPAPTVPDALMRATDGAAPVARAPSSPPSSTSTSPLAPPNAAIPPAAPLAVAPQPAVPSAAAPPAAAPQDMAEAAIAADPRASNPAALSVPDRPARRAEPAAAGSPGGMKTPEAAPGSQPSQTPPPGAPSDARSSGREDQRDPRGAPAPVETNAGRAATASAPSAVGPMASAAPLATVAVAGAMSEAASRLVRANAGTDLTTAPRPGDPVRIMEIALSPEGLGKVTVRLRLTSDGLEVRVRASDAGTAALLQQDKAQLAGILREFGCSEDRMEVSGPDGGAIGASTGPDLRAGPSSSDESGSDAQRGQQGERSQGGFQGGSGRNEGRHDDQGSRNPARGAARDPGFDAGFDPGLLDG